MQGSSLLVAALPYKSDGLDVDSAGYESRPWADQFNGAPSSRHPPPGVKTAYADVQPTSTQMKASSKDQSWAKSAYNRFKAAPVSMYHAARRPFALRPPAAPSFANVYTYRPRFAPKTPYYGDI